MLKIFKIINIITIFFFNLKEKIINKMLDNFNIIYKYIKIYKIFNPLFKLFLLLINYIVNINSNIDSNLCHSNEDLNNNYNHRLYMMYLNWLNRFNQFRRHANFLQNNNMEEFLNNTNIGRVERSPLFDNNIMENIPEDVSFWISMSCITLSICFGIWFIYKVHYSNIEDDTKISEKDLLDTWINDFD
jgi:hypothetical protein